jgi:hypothetical protein
MTTFSLQILRRAALGITFAWMLGNGATAQADVLAYWNPAGTVNSSTPLPPASAAPTVTAGNLSGGPGLDNPGLFANAYEFDNWPSGPLNTSDYLDFSVTGTGIIYSTVVFSLYNNFDGSGNWEIRSSVDGFASALDAGVFSGIFFSGELITANVSALGTRSGTVEFRLYTYNNAGATNPLERGIRGTGGSGQGLTVNGSVAAVAAAPAVSAPALGFGRWLLFAGLLLIAWYCLRIPTTK